MAAASSPFPAIRAFTRRRNWGGGCARHAMRPCSASRVGAADNQAKFFGRFTEFALPTVGAAPETIAGPDGTNKIGGITPSGRAGVARRYTRPGNFRAVVEGALVPKGPIGRGRSTARSGIGAAEGR